MAELGRASSFATTADLVRHLREELAARGGQPGDVLVHEECLPERPPVGEILRPRLPRPLAAALQAMGIRHLYRHQVAAIEAVRAGRNVVVTTPTASGKTFCFNLPILERTLADPSTRALYLNPTKALLADQLRGLEDLLAGVASAAPIRAARLDGDVPAAERDRLRADPPNLLLANPDIVHHDLLLRNRRWQAFLSHLSFVVLDELHTYRGVFGSHVALILRRLLRLAKRYGASPTIIAASATIANPAELAAQLSGREFTAIAGDDAGSFARRFLLWRPPLRGSAEHNEHRSANQEAVALFVELIRAGRTVILFGRSRVAVERMLTQARAALGRGLAERIGSYKSGYTPEERRRIEVDLREGRLQGVVATNALELGIDIGALDAAVLAGYPGSVMSTWQQAGRVGRRGGDEAIIVLVGADDALDQYYLSHPRAFFSQTSEQAVADPGNESILLGHLLCAAQEMPLYEAELGFFPAGALALVDRLVCERLLSAGQPWRFVAPDGLPHRQVSIRGVSRDQYQIVDGRWTLGTIEPPHLYREAHPGAIYLHQGAAYRVVAVDAAAKQVRVRPEPGEGRTDPLSEVGVAPRGEALQVRQIRLGEVEATLSIGPVVVEETVSGYRETVPGIRTPLTKAIEPPLGFALETIGVWLDVPEALATTEPALHAAEHALVNALPIALLCDRRDVGSANSLDASPGGRIYLFDQFEGGIGLAEKAYQVLDALVASAADLLANCRCADGCPACIHLAGCASGNDDLDKAGGLALLRGQRYAARRGASSRASAGAVAVADGGLQGRLRRIAEDTLRDRLASLAAIREGDTVHYTGFGLVTVQKIRGDKAYVQFPGAAARMWVPLAQLRPPSR